MGVQAGEDCGLGAVLGWRLRLGRRLGRGLEVLEKLGDEAGSFRGCCDFGGRCEDSEFGMNGDFFHQSRDQSRDRSGLG